MSILIFAILMLVIIALLVWAVDYLGMSNPPANLVKFLIIVVGVLIILQRSGVLT